MENFKNKPLTSNQARIFMHNRRKSDQIYSKNSIVIPSSNLSIKRITNQINPVYKNSILSRNSSVKSQSNEGPGNMSLDLSNIASSKIGLTTNLSARNPSHSKHISISLIKKFSEKNLKSNRIITKENIPPEKLALAPSVKAMFPNKFYEKLFVVEDKLSSFYSKSQNSCN